MAQTYLSYTVAQARTDDGGRRYFEPVGMIILRGDGKGVVFFADLAGTCVVFKRVGSTPRHARRHSPASIPPPRR